MIELKDIRTSYGSLEVLKGIDMHISKGEVVSIVGASGAGKTTLLQIIGTLDRPDCGEVLFEGENIFSLSDKKLDLFRNRHIGFVFQFHHLLPEFTALDNICLPAWRKGREKKEAENSAYELLEYLEIRDRAAHKPGELSGGEQQRVAVARALINNPMIVLADEPSGNLDSHTKKQLHRLFFKLREEYGQTFLIVTHDNELAALSDRCIRLKDGKIN